MLDVSQWDSNMHVKNNLLNECKDTLIHLFIFFLAFYRYLNNHSVWTLLIVPFFPNRMDILLLKLFVRIKLSYKIFHNNINK